jgi:hypothetical protein
LTLEVSDNELIQTTVPGRDMFVGLARQRIITLLVIARTAPTYSADRSKTNVMSMQIAGGNAAKSQN